MREWKNILHANGNQNKARVAIIILKKCLKIKTISRDKEGHCIMIKGSIQEEDIKIVNICAPNTRVPQYIRQTLTEIKGEIDSNTIIVGDINTLLIPNERSSKRKLILRKHKSFFFLFYNTLLVLPYIDMNPPRVYMHSQT